MFQILHFTQQQHERAFGTDPSNPSRFPLSGLQPFVIWLWQHPEVSLLGLPAWLGGLTATITKQQQKNVRFFFLLLWTSRNVNHTSFWIIVKKDMMKATSITRCFRYNKHHLSVKTITAFSPSVQNYCVPENKISVTVISVSAAAIMRGPVRQRWWISSHLSGHKYELVSMLTINNVPKCF